MRDDDRPLPLREQPEQPPDLETVEDRGDGIARGALAHRHLALRAEEAAPGLAERDPEQPALEIAVIRGRPAQPLLERVVEAVERAIGIEGRRDERAVDLRERAVVELGPPVGRLYDRYGARPLVIPGAACSVVALGTLSQIGAHTPYLLVLAAHIVLMAALAAVMTPVFSVGLGDLPAALYAHGSSLFGTIMQVSGAIGTALLVVISQARQSSLIHAGVASAEATVGGLRWAFAGGAACAVATTLLGLLLPRAASRTPRPDLAQSATEAEASL